MSDRRVQAGSSAKRRWLVLGLIGAGIALLALRPSLGKRLLRRAGSRARYLGGHMRGLAYRVGGRRPTAEVADDILADRIRSTLGPLGKRLDLPRMHVTVHDHVAILHGAVGSESDRTVIEHAVGRISGVRGIESHVHVGLARGDTRPSKGTAHPQPSEARTRLLRAAASAGIPTEETERAVRGVLVTLAERVPRGEWEDVLSHFPSDVKVMITPPRRIGGAVRTPAEFGAAVSHAAALPDAEVGERVTRAVLAVVRELVPEERTDVASALPKPLKQLWEQSTVGRQAG